MPEKNKDPWRALREQVVDKSFKLGSVFFWPQEDHWFIYVGPADDSGAYSFFIGGSSQEYWDREDNFTIVPEDFKTAKLETKSRALKRTTYFLFCQYLQHRRETKKLRELYNSGNLEYKFNLKADLPDAYDRLIDFLKNNLPPAYVKRFLDKENILSDNSH